MDYSVELHQVASRGTVLFLTNFGLSFTADYVIGVPRSFGVQADKRRVLKMLSTCHGAILDKTLGSGGLSATCHVCGEETIFPPAAREAEYLTFDSKETNLLHNIVSLVGVDVLDAIFVTDALIEILEELWDAVGNHVSVRNFLKNHEIKRPL